jgi:uncharacterized protein YbaR (Trm112 family)
MPTKPTPALEFDASIVSQLVCPACHGDLRLGNSRLICSVCGRAYPIIDGIPALIIARAEVPGESPANHQ